MKAGPRTALTVFVLALLMAAPLIGNASIRGGHPHGGAPIKEAPALVSLSTGNTSSTDQDLLTCSGTIAVAASSVLLLSSTDYAQAAFTFAVHGYTPVSLEESAGSATYPRAQIDGVVITSAATVTYYANDTADNYEDCFAADLYESSVNATFYSGIGAMTNAATASDTCALTTTASNEAVLAVFGDKHTTGSVTYTHGTGQVNMATQATTTDVDSGVEEYYAAGAAGSYTMYENASASDDAGGVCVAVLSSAAPNAPTGLTAGAITATNVPLTWTDQAAEATWLTAGEVYQATYSGGSCGSFSAVLAASAPYDAATITGLTTREALCFEVTVTNSTGTSPDSNVLSDVVTASVPLAPTGVSASPEAGSTTEISVSWTPGATTTANQTIAVAVYTSSCAASFAAILEYVNVVSPSAGSDVVGGLSTHVEYCGYVQGWNATGEGAWSVGAAATTGQAPSAPTALTVTSVTSSSVHYSWSAPSGGGILNYTFLGYAGGTCSGTVTPVNVPSGTTETFSGLSSNELVSAKVVAWNSSGQGPASSCAFGRTATVPGAPTALAVTGETASSASYGWAAPSGGGIENYTFLWYVGGSCAGTVTPVSIASGTTETVSGLSSNELISAAVTAWNATGEGSASSCVFARTATVPGAPTGMAAVALNATAVEISWSAPGGGGVVNYTARWYVTAGCTGSWTPISVDATSAVITGLAADELVSAKATAWNVTGQSAASACAFARTPIPPGTPTSLAVAAVTGSTVSLTWDAPATGGTISNYTLDVYSGTSCTGTTNAISVGTATNDTVQGLNPSSTFCFETIAWNGSLSGSYSTPVTATTNSTAANATSGGAPGGIFSATGVIIPTWWLEVLGAGLVFALLGVLYLAASPPRRGEGGG
jgi:Fibronectin type III domain